MFLAGWFRYYHDLQRLWLLVLGCLLLGAAGLFAIAAVSPRTAALIMMVIGGCAAVGAGYLFVQSIVGPDPINLRSLEDAPPGVPVPGPLQTVPPALPLPPFPPSPEPPPSLDPPPT